MFDLAAHQRRWCDLGENKFEAIIYTSYYNTDKEFIKQSSVIIKWI